MNENWLVLIWYFVICASVVFYTILDGFDLGVGMLQLFGRSDTERRIFLNSIGPVWDGNEVWLVIIGGATFAGFPIAYATICSVFYIPIMILLMGIIFRAVAIEFRSKVESPVWRQVWDVIFCVSSYVMTFLFGVLLANLVQGVRLGPEGEFLGTFWDFFTPYSILVGITGIFLFIMHGTIYLFMKTEGDLHERLRGWVPHSIAYFCIFYFLTTAATLIYMPHMGDALRDNPWLFLIALVALLVIANIPREIFRGNDWYAFLSSCLSITLLLALYAIGTFPNLLRSSLDPAKHSMTIYDAAASDGTLKIILTIAIIGVPLVIAYGFWIYRIFRGKVTLHDASY